MDAARCNYGIDPEVFLSIVDSNEGQLLVGQRRFPRLGYWSYTQSQLVKNLGIK